MITIQEVKLSRTIFKQPKNSLSILTFSLISFFHEGRLNYIKHCPKKIKKGRPLQTEVPLIHQIHKPNAELKFTELVFQELETFYN